VLGTALKYDVVNWLIRTSGMVAKLPRSALARLK